mmetsp:Transcript_98710/g.156030  ORF Transcript_98710/g.156030 Transcript_98710/m.156030 type:complete len:242 (+) Transcript_98710:1934-2659(+)
MLHLLGSSAPDMHHPRKLRVICPFGFDVLRIYVFVSPAPISRLGMWRASPLSMRSSCRNSPPSSRVWVHSSVAMAQKLCICIQRLVVTWQPYRAVALGVQTRSPCERTCTKLWKSIKRASRIQKRRGSRPSTSSSSAPGKPRSAQSNVHVKSARGSSLLQLVSYAIHVHRQRRMLQLHWPRLPSVASAASKQQSRNWQSLVLLAALCGHELQKWLTGYIGSAESRMASIPFCGTRLCVGTS